MVLSTPIGFYSVKMKPFLFVHRKKVVAKRKHKNSEKKKIVPLVQFTRRRFPFISSVRWFLLFRETAGRGRRGPSLCFGAHDAQHPSHQPLGREHRMSDEGTTESIKMRPTEAEKQGEMCNFSPLYVEIIFRVYRALMPAPVPPALNLLAGLFTTERKRPRCINFFEYRWSLFYKNTRYSVAGYSLCKLYP